VDAWERGDVDAVVAMLAEDATMAMPPAASWYGGRDVVATFLRARPLSGEERWRLVPTRANGQLAFGHYMWDAGKGRFTAHGVNVLTMRGARIGEIIAFLTPEALEYFGLPDEVEA
jgi:ketosteroid isomerase-like protein